MRTWFIFLFSQTLQIHCFNFFNVCTYHSNVCGTFLQEFQQQDSFTVPEDASHNSMCRSLHLEFFLTWQWLIMLFNWLYFMMKPGFKTCIYSWQKSFSVFLNRQEKFCTDIFSGCFVLNGEHFQQNFCSHVADNSHNHRFFNPCCSTQFPCHDRVVIPNKRINLVFVLHFCCCSWSLAAGPVTNVLSTACTITDPMSELISTAFHHIHFSDIYEYLLDWCHPQ